MKFNLIQYISFSFVVGWVFGQAMKLPYEVCLALAFFGAFVGGYLNDAHKALWQLLTGKK